MAFIGDIEIKVVVNENEQRMNEVTEKPVEDGADIADHINHKPVEFNISFVITGSDAEERRSKLREMHEADEVYSYVDVKNYSVFDNMAITSLSLSNTPDLSNGFSGSLSLKQIKVAQQKTVSSSTGTDPVTGQEVQNPAGETEDRTSGEEEINEDTADQSFLSSLFDSIGSLFGIGGNKDEG